MNKSWHKLYNQKYKEMHGAIFLAYKRECMRNYRHGKKIVSFKKFKNKNYKIEMEKQIPKTKKNHCDGCGILLSSKYVDGKHNGITCDDCLSRPKISEMFEGENSSLRRTFENCLQ